MPRVAGIVSQMPLRPDRWLGPGVGVGLTSYRRFISGNEGNQKPDGERVGTQSHGWAGAGEQCKQRGCPPVRSGSWGLSRCQCSDPGTKASLRTEKTEGVMAAGALSSRRQEAGAGHERGLAVNAGASPRGGSRGRWMEELVFFGNKSSLLNPRQGYQV